MGGWDGQERRLLQRRYPTNQLDEVLGWVRMDMERKPELYEVKNGDLEKVDDMMGRIKHNSAGCTCEGRKCGKDCTCRKRGF